MHLIITSDLGTYIMVGMSDKNKKDLNFNGGWSSGDAAHHIGKKLKACARNEMIKPKMINSFGMIKWSISMNVIAISM